MNHLKFFEENRKKTLESLDECLKRYFIVFPCFFSTKAEQSNNIGFVLSLSAQYHYCFYLQIWNYTDIEGGKTTIFPFEEKNLFTSIYKEGVWLCENLQESFPIIEENVNNFLVNQLGEESKLIISNQIENYFQSIINLYEKDEYLNILKAKERVQNYFKLQKNLDIKISMEKRLKI